MDAFLKTAANISAELRELRDQAEAEGSPLASRLDGAIEQLELSLEELYVVDEELQRHVEMGLRADSPYLIPGHDPDTTTHFPSPAESARGSGNSEKEPATPPEEAEEPFPEQASLLTDVHGMIQEANTGAARLLAVGRRALVGKPLVYRLEEPDRRGFRTLLTRLPAATGIYDVRLRLLSGAMVDVAVSVERDAVGQVTGFRWLLREFSQARLIAEESESGYRSMVESITDYAIFRLDSAGTIASWNVGGERILGYQALEIIGRHSSVLFTPEDIQRSEPQRELRTAAEKGRAMDERWHLRKDGSRFWASGAMMPLRGDANLGFVKVMRDTTQKKQEDEARLRDQALLMQQERQAAILLERNRIAQDIHDTLAQGFLGISLQLDSASEVLQGIAATAESLEITEASGFVERAARLARESLAEARRSVNALRPVALEDASLVTALARHVERMREDPEVDVRYYVEGEPIALPADVETNLLRIAQEAIGNARRHAQPKHVVVVLSFEQEALRLRITDDGRGFVRDVALDSTSFGLVSMRLRAERIGGELRVDTLPGRGTEVQVKVPRAQLWISPLPRTSRGPAKTHDLRGGPDRAVDDG